MKFVVTDAHDDATPGNPVRLVIDTTRELAVQILDEAGRIHAESVARANLDLIEKIMRGSR